MAWLRILALTAACLLTSCIDGREEMCLNPNGSGRMEIEYSLPASAAKLQGGVDGIRTMIDHFLTTSPGIKSSSYEVTSDQGRLNVLVRASFDSVLDLKKISPSGSATQVPPSVSGFAGKVDLKMHGRTVDLTRTVAPGQALPGSIFMPASKFKDRRLVYIIHLPVAADESNATRIEDDGHTLVWDVALADAVKAPISTHFKATIPIPKWIIAAGGLLVLVLGTSMIVIRRRFVRARTAAV